jgi:SAM-dependent methyltransferase
MKASNSSADIPFSQKISELVSLFYLRLRSILNHQDMSWIFSDFEEYNELLLKYSNNTLESSRVLEIGFGARPLRFIALMSLGVDVCGVDLDVPILRGTLSEFIEIYRKNGIERVLKTAVRFTCFDIIERHTLAIALKKYGKELVTYEDRFLVADAARIEICDRSLDLIISEDVFEHIHLSSVKVLVPKMARWLRPNGLALIRPNIFTGITGGHLAEWFPHTLNDKSRSRKSEPWEHLRKKRYQANTCLNQLMRVDYRDLFGSSFYILEERVREPHLGREFLTPEVASELSSYGEDELFSNRVLFVLKPKRALETEHLSQ